MKRLTLSQRDALLGLALVAPIVIYILIFVGAPFFETARLSFFKQNLLQPQKTGFIGLKNYITLVKTGDLIIMWWRTVLLAFCTITGQIIAGLIIALMLNRVFVGRAAVRSSFIIPWALPTLVAAFSIRWLFDANFGPLNHILTLLGLPMKGFPWLGRIDLAMPVVILAHIWKGLGYIILLMLAGLQTIHVELYEAAKVDGANAWQEFWKITLPHLRYVISIAFVLRFIWMFNWFDFVFLTTSGGPSKSTMTLPVAVYITAFKSFNMGKAAAIATVMALTLTVFSLLFIRVTLREEIES